MSKDRKKLLHIHSSVNDKQPTPATLELGELGVNNAKGNAFISTKNSNGDVVRFSEDETIIGWMEQKEVFPYEGYMRGADNSQVDGVTEQDLLDNKSNLIIKLNQVVPENTDYSPYDEKVNGAKDIYGNLINPISSGGYKDGAGLAIDMSKYAMIGANPSFSSITTTCHATLNGTTEIKGKGDGCGSKFTVEVANACIDATDTLNEYGVNHSNFGTSCDGTKISNDTTLKGKKIFIDSPSGDLTVDIQACNHISGRTNDFVIRECQDNGGKVEIDTTDIDVSASTTDVKSCDRISALTNDFQVKECAANGKAGISSTTINNSASTIDEKACTHISEVTNQFNITECTDGQGSVNVDTTSIDTTACTHNYNNTDDFKVTECTDGQGTTTIKSCKKFNVKSNDIVLEQCGNSGETKINSCKGISAITDNFIVEQCNSGKTHIHSCAEITLESKNITLTDGDCGSGQTTIEVNDLCLVGERKVNVYGDETNVGLDCDDSKIATNTRVFGKGTLITTKATPSAYAGENNIETVAAQDIKENADRNINETAGRSINETATGNINESAKNINNTASNDICDTAANNATFYGAVKTNVGINCDDTATAATTTVKGGKVIVDASTTDLGLTAKQDILESSERDIIITANDDICETAGDEATFYGVSLTRLGITCDGAVKTTQTEIGGDDITVYADDVLCESGKTVTVFAGEGGKLTIGGNSCDGNTSGTYPITYVRRPKTGTCDIHATTVDDALDEVYDRSRISLTSTAHTDSSTGSNYSYTEYTLHQDSGTCDANINFTVNDTIVSMSASTNPDGATGETLTTYHLWQYIGDEKKDIGKINIPKDHLIEDVRIVYGTVKDDPTTSGQTFITCSAQSQDCHWYIEMKWYVWDGSHTDKLTYLPADDFVKDIDENNSDNNRGVDVNVWYNQTSGRNEVSADTKLNFTTTNGDFKYEKHDGQHYESGTTLTFEEGSFSAQTYQPWVTSRTVKVPTHVSHLGRGKLTINSGSTCGFSGATFDPSGNTTITIPTCVSDLSRATLKWEYGATCSESGGTYDPGEHCDRSGANCLKHTDTIIIPKTISDITNGKVTLGGTCDSPSCLTITTDICMESNTIAAKAFYSKSDESLKENIESINGQDISKVNNVYFKSFNFKDDETKTKTYGVIAQSVKASGLDNIVHKDESGTLNVDYISLLILKIASLEQKVEMLTNELNNHKLYGK